VLRRTKSEAFYDSLLPVIARRQGGVFTEEQALQDGAPYGMVRGALRKGRWVKVLGLGLVSASREIGLLQRCWAAMLTWPDSVIFGVSAIAIWQLLKPRFMPMPQLPPLPPEQPLWLAVSSGRRPSRNVRLCKIPVSLNIEWPTGGLRIAEPAHCFADALATVPKPEADAMFSWLVSRRILTAELLQDEIQRFRNRTGANRLRQYLKLAESGAASELEMRVHMLLRDAGITGWETNAPIYVNGAIVASADILFRKHSLIIEVDGYRAHSTKEAFITDRRRTRTLIAAGYRVLPFSWQDITETPGAFIAQIRSTLANRSPNS
jgi:very-short-patch-repair endonuclease